MRLRPATDLVAVASDRAAQEGSTAVICADAAVEPTAAHLRSAGLDVTVLGDGDTGELMAGHLVVVPAGLAKGLEHDHVIVVDPAAVLAAEPRGLQRLYVVLTRAVTSLTVVGAEGLPEVLAAPR